MVNLFWPVLCKSNRYDFDPIQALNLKVVSTYIPVALISSAVSSHSGRADIKTFQAHHSGIIVHDKEISNVSKYLNKLRSLNQISFA